MKKFRFTLDKLKDYREQVLESEKNTLAGLRHEQQLILDNIAALRNELDKSEMDFRIKSQGGISVMQIGLIKNYQNSVHEQIKALLADSQKMEDRIHRQLNVVIEASKDVSSLDKLEEHQLEDYRFMLSKDEEKFISEYVLNSTYIKAV